MLQKNFRLEVKSVEEDGTFSGYASVTGNIDSDNEIIDKGAFKRTLDHTKGVVPILWQHDRKSPVGWNVSAQEDGKGLAVTGKLMVDTELGRYAQSFLKTGLEVGANPGLSIGFTVPKDGAYVKDGRRHFREVALKEYSIATFQSNPEAIVNIAKDAATTKRVAGEDLPASAFAYVGDPENNETWKLPIKFSSDAKTASHIRNALARFSQTEGIPESEKPTVLAKIKHAAKEHGIDVSDKAEKQAAKTQLREEKSNIESTLATSVLDVLRNESFSHEEKASAVAEAYAQLAVAMGDWYAKFIASELDDDAAKDVSVDSEQEKSGRAISAATADKIKMGIDHIEKGLGHLRALYEEPANSYLANDTYSANPTGGGKEENTETTEKSEVTEKSESVETGDPELLHSLLALGARFAPQQPPQSK